MRQQLWRIAKLVLPEVFGVILNLVGIYIIRRVLEFLLGHDATFFDIVPIRYVTDLGEITVLLRFIWRALSGKLED